MKLIDWVSFDLRHIPTPALQAVSSSIKAELIARRREASIQRTTERDMSNAISNLARHPKPQHQFNRHWLPYLDELVRQDWSAIYCGGDSEKKYYVYAHVRPSGKTIRYKGSSIELDLPGLPFYIGKGCGGRAYDLNRNQGHGAILSELASSGVHPQEIVRIIDDGLTEAEALELEAKLIYFFGTQYQRGRRGILVNLDVPRVPSELAR
jgi:hypothetical protein